MGEFVTYNPKTGETDDYDLWAFILDPDEMPERPLRAAGGPGSGRYPKGSGDSASTVNESQNLAPTVSRKTGLPFSPERQEAIRKSWETPSTPSVEYQREVETTATIDALKDAIGETIGSNRVYLEGSPLSLRVADTVSSTLKEMKDKGYTMPDKVFVQRDSNLAPHGSLERVVIDGQITTELHIYMPATLPEDANVDDVIWMVFSGSTDDGDPKFSITTMKDVIIHEMGHVQVRAERRLSAPTSFDSAYQHFAAIADGDINEVVVERAGRAAKSVSNYGWHGGMQEFLAEAFVRKYRGEKLTPDAETMYKLLEGPAIR